MKKLINLILLLFIPVIMACSAQVDVEADMDAIAQAGDQLIAALENDDVDGIMSGLTDDHITMAPNVPDFADLTELRAWHQERVDNFTWNSENFTRDEVELIGDWAYERWSGIAILTPRSDGDQVHYDSKGIWIWKRQADGTWKLARSIWNSMILADSVWRCLLLERERPSSCSKQAWGKTDAIGLTFKIR